MNYLQELTERHSIDCYWESHEVVGGKEYVYPSLPEPYINLFFPIASHEPARIKGISSRPDYLSMKCKLFGVRLLLKGFLELHLGPACNISNKLIDFNGIGSGDEEALSQKISEAGSFESRTAIFRQYFEQKKSKPLSEQQIRLYSAFKYLMEQYRSPNIVLEYSKKVDVSERTLHRWFNEGIGISPKNLAQITRFHTALHHLHAQDEPGFYFDFGYFDQAHFIREFKKYTGYTPKSYLKYTSDLYN